MHKTRHTFVKTKLLFALTIIFIALAILIGILINLIGMNEQNSWIFIIYIVLLVSLALFILIGFTLNAISVLQLIYSEKGNLIALYKSDKIFRISVTNAFTCTFSLFTAFLYFYSAFSHSTAYYLACATIFFSIFIMKLYMTVHIENRVRKQSAFIGAFTLVVALASLTLLIIFILKKPEFSLIPIVVYWDMVYCLFAFTSAIIGIVQAVKRKDRVLGRFLSIKLANALCISFIITISAILTFHLSYLPMRTFCIIIGTINTLIIFGISAFHLYSSVRQPKSTR